MTDGADYSLVLAFDTSDAEFCRGFEAGRIWQMLKNEDSVDAELVHGANAEMLLRMSEATRRPIAGAVLDDTWIEVSFDRLGAEPHHHGGSAPGLDQN
jgi:hypothetical protein